MLFLQFVVFSSLLFIFIFLPAVLGGYYLLPEKSKNFFLLLVSLFFYYVGESSLVILFILSVLINYTFGFLIASQSKQRIFLSIGITINLSFLIYFKYANFAIDNLLYWDLVSPSFQREVILPIGISFYTFQGISYLIDVYRDNTFFQKNLIKLSLFISFFPQLIAGPIIKYSDISEQLTCRQSSLHLFVSGIKKFIRGLAKKVIIANHVAIISAKSFSLEAGELSTPAAWLGIIAFSIQIYYDFSGYSDMAIGMGRMFGFNFKENFDHPYTATSVRLFWRKWHISLSTWFRDYVYIPLGGSKKNAVYVYRNLIIVFMLTGLWHGANWNFLVWGLFHGFFIICERLYPWKKAPKPLQHVYLIVVVVVSWVLFNAHDLTHSIDYITTLFVFDMTGNYLPFIYLTNYSIFIFILGIIFCMPIRQYLMNIKSISWLSPVSYILLFIFTISELVQSSYNPFIYFRF